MTTARGMASYEQDSVLQSQLFDPNLQFWTSFSNMYGRYITSLIPNTASFTNFLPNGNIGLAADRLNWFNNNLFPAWQTWVQNDLAPIDVDKLFSGGYT